MTHDTRRSDGGHDPLSGLYHLYCPSCRHKGTIPSGDLHVLFCTSHRYVVAYGPSLATITVVMTNDTIAAYRAYGLCSGDLVKLAAAWALLSGTLSGAVTLTLDRQEFLDFGRYLRTQSLQRTFLRAV